MVPLMIDTLALDLEGTLISNAMSQIPRPGLFSFLETCHHLANKVVIYTTVEEQLFREIAKRLCGEGFAPEWFSKIHYVDWYGDTKNLECIPACALEHTYLVDDYEGYVHPKQKKQWIHAPHFAHPYPDTDNGLDTVTLKLKALACTS